MTHKKFRIYMERLFKIEMMRTNEIDDITMDLLTAYLDVLRPFIELKDIVDSLDIPIKLITSDEINQSTYDYLGERLAFSQVFHAGTIKKATFDLMSYYLKALKPFVELNKRIDKLA